MSSYKLILMALFAAIALSIQHRTGPKIVNDISLLEIINSEEFKCLKTIHQEMVKKQYQSKNSPLFLSFSACWTPGSGASDLLNFYQTYASVFPNSLSMNVEKPGPKSFEFNDGNRWDITATNGGGLQQGDPTTLTWSFIPDGTSIYGYNGEPTSNSVLIAMLDAQYDPMHTGGIDLTQRAWFVHFEDIFQRWSQLTGNKYIYEPNDDGDAFTAANIAMGLLGVRGDIRIGGHSIDGASGSNVLAYNFFPNYGDMVIDTDNSAFYGNTSGGSLGLRNTLSHEHGHGLGISHTCPRSNTKLMEPYISFAFDGPQFDDILAANRGYGDGMEDNNTVGDATDLGEINDGQTVNLSDISIDDDGDTDYLKFVAPLNSEVSITLTPIGSTYLAGAQNNDGSCSAGSSFNPKNQSNLSFELLAPNGTTVIYTANANPAGSVESVSNQSLSDGAGTYYIKVNGSANAVQLYTLAVSINVINIPGCTDTDAHNYNSAANLDDGSCETCMDNLQNGDETNVDCGGSKCVPCVTGCMDAGACNYLASANVAGPCDYSCLGCTNPLANNYDPSATIENDTCNFDCTDITNVIDNSNVNMVVISSSDTLKTLGILSASADTIHYQAKKVFLFNSDFEVNLGSILTVVVDSCH